MMKKQLLSLALAAVTAVPTFTGAVTLANATQPIPYVMASTEQNVLRNVMYYGDWSIWGGQGNFYPTDMPANLYTHLNYAFMDFDAAGNLIFTDADAAGAASLGQSGVTWGDVNSGILPALTSLRAENPNMKIGISVGGWSKSGDFSAMASNPTARANFVEQIVKFVEYTGMDFVDIDWEYPSSVREADLVDNKNDEGTPNALPEDKENYITLLEDLRTALDISGAEIGKEYEISVALPISQTKLENGVDVARMFEIIDFGNLMTYDARGAWDDVSGHQTALYGNPDDPMYDDGFSVDQTVQYMLANGAPAEKIVIGAAFYTRGWESVSNDGGVDGLPGLFGSAEIATLDADQTPSRGASNDVALSNGDGGRNSGLWAYRNLSSLQSSYTGLVEYWDDVAKAPYLYNGDAFFTYDNEQSVAEKANYVIENGLGGMISWMASQDAATTSTQRDALTSAIYEGLYGTATLSDNEIIVTPLDVTVSVSTYSSTWAGGGYNITITNNEKAEESNSVLEIVEAQKETIMLPKLYIDNSGISLASGGYGAGTVTNENGLTVVDLSAVYDNKLIGQNASITLQLAYTGSEEVSVDNLNSITLSQRTTTAGPEFNPQVIYGSTSNEAVNTAPVLTGTANRILEIGADFNALDGVAATDKEDGNITSKITVSGTVNTSVAGTYVLTYTVTDSEGLTATATRTITVNAEVVTPEVTPDPEVEDDKDEETTTPPVTPEVPDKDDSQTVVPQLDELDFGVGYGIEWEDGIFAPFADMGAWVSDANYSNSGALDLGTIMAETGTKYFNLGFINAVDSTVDANGVLNWGFGGYEVLSEEHADSNAQYNGIKKSISDVRALGGDVIISIGGLNENNFFQYTTDLDVLVNTYVEIIDGFNLTRIDLDIEGGAQGYDINKLNAQAMKIVQEKTGVEVVLTLPVLPTGLTEYLGLATVQAYLDAGVDIEAVNIMAMCYGSYFGDYAVASVEAIDSTMQQLKTAYANAGITLTDAEAYNKVAITTSIGFEGSAHPVFTVADSQLVVDYAKEKAINFVSFWSINRDSQTQSNTGIYSKYEHTDVYLGFQDDSVTTTPTPDPEVDPTPDPTPDPEVDTTPDPTPDPEVDTTPDPEVDTDGEYPTWSREVEATGEYTPDYVVTYKGTVYKQVASFVSWWCEPGTNDSVWSPIGSDSDYSAPAATVWSREVEATGAYAPGTVVTHNGEIYKQVATYVSWWCEPGTNDSIWAVQ